MTCYRPLEAARPTGSNLKPIIYAKGRRPKPLAPGWDALALPCGQCIGCRLNTSADWAVRMMHEASLHKENAFITLTYSDENLPTDGSLVPEHFTKFMKKLRREIAPKRIRFFHCGEYGEKLTRPHYHAIIFGHCFPDRKYLKREDGHNLFVSEQLDRVWGKGHGFIGEVTFESAAYVARYVTKKVTGSRQPEHYLIESPTGAFVEVQPEYATMSRRPGLAADWFEEFETDVYPWDEVIVSGRSRRPPRYYDKKLADSDPDQLAKLSCEREKKAAKRAKEHTPARLHAREKVAKAKTKLYLTRSLEK